MSDLIPRFSEQGYSTEAVAARRRWMEERTGQTLEQVGDFCFPAEEMLGNVENPIGAVQVPLGVAGPLLVHGDHAEGVFFVPMATTEGALVRCPAGSRPCAPRPRLPPGTAGCCGSSPCRSAAR